MGSEFNKMVREFANSLKNIPDSKTSPYDTQAEVRRVEGNIAWVHIPGGVDETPVQLTTNAKKGDIVQVRVSGGRAWLYGNQTSPPTDDTTAKEAQKTAAVADEHAVNAVTSAMLAQQFAETAREEAASASSAASQAWTKAGEAETAANQATQALTTVQNNLTETTRLATEAKGAADRAETSAAEAYTSATAAQWQLGMVEDVVGTLEWIATHAIYQLTEDTTVETGKWYYSLAATVVPQANLKVFELQSGRYYLPTTKFVYTAVAEPDVADIATYYEYDSETGTYSLTEDVAIDEEKTYYTRSQFPYYTVATGSAINPSLTYYTVVASSVIPAAGSNPSALGYYEIGSYDKTVQNYISTHLSLDDSGLHLTDGNLKNRMDISQNTGIIMYNNGKQVAKYGTDTIIGDPMSFHIEITADPPMLSFCTGQDSQGNVVRVAYMTGEVLNIPRVVVVDSMQIGYWMWDGNTKPYHLTLKWIGPRGATGATGATGST